MEHRLAKQVAAHAGCAPTACSGMQHNGDGNVALEKTTKGDITAKVEITTNSDIGGGCRFITLQMIRLTVS